MSIMLVNSFGRGSGDPYFANVVLLVHFDGTNGSTAFTNVVYPARGNLISGTFPAVSTTAPLFGTGSGSFAGNGGIRSNASGGWYTFGTGDFSIEVAMKTASPTQASSSIFDMRTSANATIAPAIFIQAGTFYIETDGATWSIANVGSVATSTWQRLGLFRVSGTTYFMVDGTVLGSFADTHNYGALDIAVGSGWTTGANYTGNLDELRVTQGVGRHSANYTVDAAAFPDQQGAAVTDPYAAFLSGGWHFDSVVSTAYPDSSGNGSDLPQGGSSLDTSVFKFGAGSLLSSSGNTGCKVHTTTLFTVRTGDFAVDGWCRPTSVTGYQTLWSVGDGGTDCRVYSSAGGDGMIRVYVNSVVIIQGGTLSLNTWHHVRLSRVSGVCYLGVDGAQAGSSGANSIDHTGADFDVGNNTASTNTEFFAGNIDDVRFYKGSGIGYTGGSYTVPTAAFT